MLAHWDESQYPGGPGGPRIPEFPGRPGGQGGPLEPVDPGGPVLDSPCGPSMKMKQTPEAVSNTQVTDISTNLKLKYHSLGHDKKTSL